jgi:lysophospholipase L1-like esterase
MKRLCLSVLFLILGLSAAAAFGQTKLDVKAGDLWVMTGDSITAQRLHSNYIEAFYRARYPTLHLQFRNSGIGGNRTGSVLARFDYDVAAWKPTIVSVELGMNDVGAGDNPSQYIEGMKKLIERIRAVRATPVLISSSPVNDGSYMDHWKSDRCRRIHPYTEALGKLAQEEKVAFVDQYHPLLELWAKNKQADGKERVALGGDAVHPGPVGQMTMAATILAGLGVDGEVSSAVLSADGKVVEQKLCQISEVSAKDGGLAFTRLDERGPWPMSAKCRDALKLMPQIADLSRYLLKVTGLPDGQYTVSMNGTAVAKLSAKDLAAGWNMSTVAEGVIAQRGEKIAGLVATLQGPLNNPWRAASKAKQADKLADCQKAIDACEAQLAEACQPVAIKFEIRPAKGDSTGK